MALTIASNADCISQEGQANLRLHSRRLSRRLDRRGILNSALEIELIHAETGGVRIKVELKLEGSNYIHVAKAGADEAGVISYALGALIKQCDRQELKTKRHIHHRIQKRKARRLRLANAPADQSILTSSLWQTLWPWLVRQSTGAVLELQSTGAIAPGDLSPIDLAEEVVLCFIEQSTTPKGVPSTRALLLKLLEQTLNETLAQFNSSPKTSTLKIAEKAVADELRILGDNVMELCQIHARDQGSLKETLSNDEDSKIDHHNTLKMLLWSALSTLNSCERHAYCSKVMDNENYEDIATAADTTPIKAAKDFESAEIKLHTYLDNKIIGAKQPNWVALLYTSLGRQFSEGLSKVPIPLLSEPASARDKILSWT